MIQPYTEEVSRNNPLTVIFLVDQSGSMDAPFGGGISVSKAQVTSDALNKLLDTLVIKATKGEEVYNYCYVSIIGYGEKVGSAFGGILEKKELITLSELQEHRLRVEMRTRKISDGAGGLVEYEEPFSVWVEPKAEGMTPMRRAFEKALQLVDSALQEKPNSHPPIVINITDGAYTPPGDQGTPASIAREIMSKQNTNGSNALVFNSHITHEQIGAILYPASDTGIKDDYAKELLSMSSPIPQLWLSLAAARKMDAIGEGSRGFVYNADVVTLIEFINFGTQIAVGGEIYPGQSELREVRPDRSSGSGEAIGKPDGRLASGEPDLSKD
ncbi:VWA domain-containing protein [Desulfomonile tiedjei]|uniref:VWFA domain-containing protein n=1 Tax=Desulfomonile tiedjei (strain ATCC 49306 / DSM 6799 / DCB-1) TaxID=706587 RepID=I4C5G2_DESTA|nr:VWA domain-containing protein [Desulfomonile tiedjei]AFM24803.1 hypothetical protein Desti_2104 [Desulfomonile tiedjei DSM 6799]